MSPFPKLPADTRERVRRSGPFCRWLVMTSLGVSPSLFGCTLTSDSFDPREASGSLQPDAGNGSLDPGTPPGPGSGGEPSMPCSAGAEIAGCDLGLMPGSRCDSDRE